MKRGEEERERQKGVGGRAVFAVCESGGILGIEFTNWVPFTIGVRPSKF